MGAKLESFNVAKTVPVRRAAAKVTARPQAAAAAVAPPTAATTVTTTLIEPKWEPSASPNKWRSARRAAHASQPQSHNPASDTEMTPDVEPENIVTESELKKQLRTAQAMLKTLKRNKDSYACKKIEETENDIADLGMTID